RTRFRLERGNANSRGRGGTPDRRSAGSIQAAPGRKVENFWESSRRGLRWLRHFAGCGEALLWPEAATRLIEARLQPDASGFDMSATDFQQLVDRQYAPLYRFALSLSKSEADAADLTQQTFFLWVSKGHQLRDRSKAKAKAWLFTTLYREFLGRRRREVRFPKVVL